VSRTDLKIKLTEIEEVEDAVAAIGNEDRNPLLARMGHSMEQRLSDQEKSLAR